MIPTFLEEESHVMVSILKEKNFRPLPWFPHSQRGRARRWFQSIGDYWRKLLKTSLLHLSTIFMQTINWIDSENDVIWGNKVIKYVWCQQSKHGSWCISTMSWSCTERESNIVWGWKSIKLQHHQYRRHVSRLHHLASLSSISTFLDFDEVSN